MRTTRMTVMAYMPCTTRETHAHCGLGLGRGCADGRAIGPQNAKMQRAGQVKAGWSGEGARLALWGRAGREGMGATAGGRSLPMGGQGPEEA